MRRPVRPALPRRPRRGWPRSSARFWHLTLAAPPPEATHWTLRAMARVAGLAASTVHDIWKAHGLAPHRRRQFKLSDDKAFAERLHDVTGLYVSPPAQAVFVKQVVR